MRLKYHIMLFSSFVAAAALVAPAAGQAFDQPRDRDREGRDDQRWRDDDQRWRDDTRFRDDRQGRDTRMGRFEFVPSDDIVGARVMDHHDDRLGTVDDLIVDRRTGEVKFMVIRYGGFIGIGDRRVALPWHAGRFVHEPDAPLRAGTYRINLREDDLDRLPEFRRGDWAMLRSTEYRRELGRVVDDPGMRQPVRDRDRWDDRWERDRRDEDHGERDRWDQDRRQQGHRDQDRWGERERQREDPFARQRERDPYQAVFARAETSTLTGTVESVQGHRARELQEEHILINLRDDEGRDYRVLLGPAWYIQQEANIIPFGERMRITAARTSDTQGTLWIASRASWRGENVALRETRTGEPRWDRDDKRSWDDQRGRDGQRLGDDDRRFRDDRRRDDQRWRDDDRDRDRDARRPLTGRERRMARMHDEQFLRVSDIERARVFIDDRKTARVEEAVIEVNTGALAYVTLTRDRFWRIGEDRHIVPWDAVRVDPDGDLVLLIPVRDIEHLPRLPDDDVAMLNQERFRTHVHQALGIREPRFERARFEEPARFERDRRERDRFEPREQERDPRRERDQRDEPDRGLRIDEEQEYTGTIVTVTRATTPRHTGEDAMVVILRANGRQHHVHIEPAAAIQRRQIHLKEGTEVKVRGRMMQVGERQMLVATHLEVDDEKIDLRTPDRSLNHQP